MPTKFDPDGLPIWEKQGDLYVHEDTIQMAFGWGCLVEGFNLPEFDIWLSALPSCIAKTQLLERRAKAFEAGRSNNRDRELRHLEFMAMRMRAIQREDALLPPARIGRTVNKGRSEGGKKSAMHRQAENKSRDESLLKTANALIDAGDATKRTVKTLMIERGLNRGLGIDRLRQVLAQSGIK